MSKDYTKKYGKGNVSDIEEAKRRCIDMEFACSGITQKKKYFSLRKGKIPKLSPSGESSWIKK